MVSLATEEVFVVGLATLATTPSVFIDLKKAAAEKDNIRNLLESFL